MVDAEPVLARFDAPVADIPTRVAVLSDLHLAVEDSGTWRVSHRTVDRLESAVTSLNQQDDLDGVLFIGDLVNQGTRPQYERFDQVIERLDHPLFAIPGNHDLISWGAENPLTLREFEQQYTPGELPYHEQLGGIDLLALNSNRSTRDAVAESYEGQLSPETLTWLGEKLETVDHPLVVVHHALPGTRSILMDTMDQLPVSGGSPDFTNGDELTNVLVDRGAPLVLTGHLHFPSISTMQGLHEFTLPSLGPYPNAYTVLKIDEEGTTATMHSVSDYNDRIESFVHGVEHTRVQLAAAQLAGLPLLDELSERG